MEIIKASVVKVEDKHVIKIEYEDGESDIPISVDRPIEVKAAFNKLIARIKDGEFQIELEQVGEDLFSQVAKEYIMQLNREIHEVYGEMRQYGLVVE